MPSAPVPLLLFSRRLLSDQLTPVLAYRRLVAPDDRAAPSFLFESVENGTNVGRWSMLGAQPALEVVARGHAVTVHDRRARTTRHLTSENPLAALRDLAAGFQPRAVDAMPDAFHGGWVGYCGFDAVRYLEPNKLPFARAPKDDRGLPDVHFGLYRQVAVFDHVAKLVHAVVAVPANEHANEAAAAAAGQSELDAFCARLVGGGPALAPGVVNMDLAHRPKAPDRSSMSRDQFMAAVERTKEYIRAGDAFQVVLSQRLERSTLADPFDVYRTLRVVNP
ncbi:MAG: chorismate-binding protein, partial [Phycisphaerae bacterium]|nr:chorismate-binding protein [Phycisphaerae bacterium]